jgi:DNA polymerase IV
LLRTTLPYVWEQILVQPQIREIFSEYTPLVEPLSRDEAYLDVIENLKGIPYTTQVAREIRARI